MGELMLAVIAGFVVALLGTAVGVSGAVFLLPVELSVLGVSGPAVSSTNLLFNVISTPAALRRLRVKTEPSSRRLGTDHVGVVAAVCVPAAVLGAYMRVSVLADPSRFRLLLVAVLLPLGVNLLMRSVRGTSKTRMPVRDPMGGGRVRPLAGLAFIGGCIGGVLGIGGGSLLAPALVGLAGWPVRRAAPLALTATLSTSVTGLLAYTLLDAADIGAAPAAPFWGIGLALGLGGLGGASVASALQHRLLQHRLGERLLTALLGAIATVTAISYLLRA
ncbi:TSUP family transporter [Streptosporangium sp. 'caverna']|uniref:TSUP family transporter n=1 Tax=Streptosporangium sp. 'caverna' TaxID=2202249 RepID=UPI000D7E51F5|nr:TSUP family transporter [Streptosporangium sp. 'caverna']AWS46895.1 sulfite exporter TauE/SafE family protein [Streptosporangium sp. 'caverna']